MRNADPRDLLGWTDSEVAAVDERLGLVNAWLAHAGLQGKATDRVRLWHGGRHPGANWNLWMKGTASVLQNLIALALLRHDPAIERAPGCDVILSGMSQGIVLDLDGLVVEGLSKLDLSKPGPKLLSEIAALVRAEGAIEAATDASRPCPQAAGGDSCVFPKCDCPGGVHHPGAGVQAASPSAQPIA